MYSDAKQELQRVKIQLARSAPLPTKSPSLAAQHLLKQVEMVCRNAIEHSNEAVTLILSCDDDSCMPLHFRYR